MRRILHANEKFGNSGLRPDTKIYEAFDVYRNNCRSGAIDDDAGLCLSRAQVLSTLEAHTDTVCLALLHKMPQEKLEHLAQKFGIGLLSFHAGEIAAMGDTGYESIGRMTEPVRQYALAKGITMISAFMGEATAFEEERADKPDGALIRVPTLSSPEFLRRLRDEVAGETTNSLLSNAFQNALQQALPVHDAYARAVALQDEEERSAMGGMVYRPLPPGTLPDAPEVRKAHDFAHTHALIDGNDLDRAMKTARLLTEKQAEDRIGDATVAAALLDVAYRMRGPSHIMPHGTGLDVARILRGRSVYSVKSAQDLDAAPPAFRQIAIAHAIVETEDHLETSRKILAATATKLHMRKYQPQIVSAVREREKTMRAVYLPAADNMDAPNLAVRFRTTLVAQSATLDPYSRKPGGPAP